MAFYDMAYSLKVTPNSMMIGMQEVCLKLLEQTSQNIANASTVGFKAFRTKVKESSQNAQGNALSNITIGKVERSYGNGALRLTDNPYDLAITGSGFFSVQTENGIRYTRNGQFQLNDNGFVVDAHGNFLLNEGQTPIQLPRGTECFIAKNGLISVNGKPSGTVGIFSFDDLSQMQPNGYNLFTNNQDPKPAVNFFLTQGAVEESNVSIMDEAINLITIQRNFEYAQKMIEEYDQQQKKINQINPRNA